MPKNIMGSKCAMAQPSESFQPDGHSGQARRKCKLSPQGCDRGSGCCGYYEGEEEGVYEAGKYGSMKTANERQGMRRKFCLVEELH